MNGWALVLVVGVTFVSLFVVGLALFDLAYELRKLRKATEAQSEDLRALRKRIAWLGTQLGVPMPKDDASDAKTLAHWIGGEG